MFPLIEGSEGKYRLKGLIQAAAGISAAALDGKEKLQWITYTEAIFIMRI